MSSIDKANLISLLVILTINIGVFVGISRLGAEGRRENVLWAHALWTANWFFWFLAWIAYLHHLHILGVDILEDVGAFCLIGFAVGHLGGRNALKKYAVVAALLFVLDLAWILTAGTSAPVGSGGTDKEALDAVNNALKTFPHVLARIGDRLTNVWPRTDDAILNNTFLFAPSLCLAVFALGIVAWSFIHRSEGQDWLISSFIGFLSLVYALFQVPIYQANLFVPGGLKMSAGLQILFLCWRMGLVLFYWVAIWGSAGVVVPLRRVWGTIATLLPLIGTVIQLLRHR